MVIDNDIERIERIITSEDFVLSSDQKDFYNRLIRHLEHLKNLKPELRPFTEFEVEEKFKQNSRIRYRIKGSDRIYVGNVEYSFVPYEDNSMYIYLGTRTYSLQEAFERIEFLDGTRWRPFGVEGDTD